MPLPVVVLLLAAGAVAAVAASSKKRPRLTPGPGKFAETDRSASDVKSGPAAKVGAHILGVFGTATAGEYPAPYRYQDARKIADIALAAGSKAPPAHRHHYDIIRDRSVKIDAANMSNAHKTYALIMTVVLPSLGGASALWWHWYRAKAQHFYWSPDEKPLTKQEKKDQFNAIGAWALMFSALPETATAARTSTQMIGSSLLPTFGDYLNPEGKLIGGLTPFQTRMLLNEIAHYLIRWPRDNDSSRDWWRPFEEASRNQLDAWQLAYPFDGGDAQVVEGNFKLVEVLLWWTNAHVNMELKFNFDEGTAWAALFVKVVAALVSAVSPFVSPAVAAAMQVAAAAIFALAKAMADGEITAEEFQAMGGAAVSFALQQSGIDLGLPDEMVQVGELVGEELL